MALGTGRRAVSYALLMVSESGTATFLLRTSLPVFRQMTAHLGEPQVLRGRSQPEPVGATAVTVKRRLTSVADRRTFLAVERAREGLPGRLVVVHLSIGLLDRLAGGRAQGPHPNPGSARGDLS